MNSEYEFIVATPAIFIGGGELEKVMAYFHENGLKGHKKIALDYSPSPTSWAWGPFMKMRF
jgi:hypothetical protein